MAKLQGRFPISKNAYAVMLDLVKWPYMHTCVVCFFRVRFSFMVLQTFQTRPYHTQYDCECGMVLRSVRDQAIQAHLQGEPHKKRMQDNDPWQDYECDCGRKLERVKAFQIKQHRESPVCREARLHILSQNFMAERVQSVPSDFAFEEESNPPPVAEADPCVGPADEVMVEVDDTRFATCPGFGPEQLTLETFYKLYPFAIHTPGGIPNCPPVSWLPGRNVGFNVACDGTMHDGEKCCEHCAELKDSEALKKVVEYAIDATPRSDYL